MHVTRFNHHFTNEALLVDCPLIFLLSFRTDNKIVRILFNVIPSRIPQTSY